LFAVSVEVTMEEGTVSLRDLLRSRLFWLCTVAMGQGILFLIFPRLPASLEVVFGATLVVLLASTCTQRSRRHRDLDREEV
jgi:hypothetical protein